MNKCLSAAIAATLLSLAAAPASAADFSFTGNLANGDEVQFFNFSVGAPSLVSLVTYSYAGGVNAAGQTITRGGFDPILSLYDATGAKVGFNDDGGCGLVALDTASGQCWDTFFTATLASGNYSVAVSTFANFGPDQLPGVFPGSGHFDFSDVSGASNNPRDSHWAFDVLNVDSAILVPPGAVPEPATWAMMIIGFGAVGSMVRTSRRRNAFVAT